MLTRLLLVLALVTACPRTGGQTPSGSVEGIVQLPAVAKPKNNRYPGKPLPEYLRGPAVVFIDAVPGSHAPPAEKLVIGQEKRQFDPLALAVLKGTTVSFPNRDSEYHNVFSQSDAKTLDLGRYATNESRDVTFDKAGVVRLRCAIHANMHAVVVVLENPHFAVTDAAGRFRLAGVPPGKYRIYAFHEDYEPPDAKGDPLRAVGQEVEIVAGGTAKADFDLRKK